ncbi:very short patch repair endonuclease [Geotalea uraniireducens]|uniref:very short patch repair endonuclease n=1 Tax=Geotalea uraniireducens TaxID=351604 RepID=UPI002493C979|nr:very short patch repair endonuclease [Geotalea uraniireducens]
MDTVDKQARSRIMSRVGQKNTGPEMRLRRSLHKIGLRYRLHDKKLPGTPDIVFPRFKAVVFVHGCFWHRHGCKATTPPGTNVDFWRKKFDENIARDRRNTESLRNAGWRVAVIWECALKKKCADPDVIARLVCEWLASGEEYNKNLTIPDSRGTP